MSSVSYAVLFFGLSALPSLAQPSIGGGTCDSSTIKGVYAITLTGRQVSSAGAFSNVFQANGSATFDGLSKATLSLVVDTGQAAATPVTWSGNYSMQVNCAGLLTITTGGTATFNIVLFGSGANFLLSGNDSVYAYSGNGDSQAASCSLSTISGVYTFSATGYSLSSGSVNGVTNLTGLAQFDGQGHVTLNLTASPANTNLSALTGTYSVSANCLGSATLTDSNKNSYVSSFSVFTGSSTSSTAFYMTLAQSSKMIVSGTAHAAYGQPTASLVSPARKNAALHLFVTRGGRA